MRTIEVDFDVHQAIEAERRGFEDSANAALRRLLHLGAPKVTDDAPALPVQGRVGTTAPANDAGQPPTGAWRRKGVELPEGSALLVNYSDVKERGVVQGGRLVFDGRGYDTPSQAAMAVVQRHRQKAVSINGWLHLQVQLPGRTGWTSLNQLRTPAHAS